MAGCGGWREKQTIKRYCGICGGLLGAGNVVGFCRRTPECNRARQRARLNQPPEDRFCKGCGARVGPKNLTGYCGKNLECRRLYMEIYRYQRPLVSTWQMAKQRCYNPRNKKYPRYGARGITMYGPWIDDYRAFETWVFANLGPRPEGRHPSGLPLYSLDRKDNDGNYEPGNLQWSDGEAQVFNRGPQGASVAVIDALRAQIRELGAIPVA